MHRNSVHKKNFFEINIPCLKKADRENLASLLEKFFQRISFTEKTQHIHNLLTNEFIQYFRNNNFNLPIELYDMNYDFLNEIHSNISNMEPNALYVICSALKNAIACTYIIPILIFFKTNHPLTYPMEFALTQLNSLLVNHCNKKNSCYEFFKRIFLRHNEDTRSYDERLDIALYQHYMDRTNSLNVDYKKNFQILFQMMKENVFESFGDVLKNNPADFNNVILLLKDKLIFDSATEASCKELFFEFICHYPETLTPANTALPTANTKSKLFLECIEEQSKHCSRQQQAKLAEILIGFKNDPEKALTTLWRIILLAKVFVERPGFLIFLKPKENQTDNFWKQLHKLHQAIGKVYCTCYPEQRSSKNQQIKK